MKKHQEKGRIPHKTVVAGAAAGAGEGAGAGAGGEESVTLAGLK